MTPAERDAHSLFSIVTLGGTLLLCAVLSMLYSRGLHSLAALLLLLFLVAFALKAIHHWTKTAFGVVAGGLRWRELGLPTKVFLIGGAAAALVVAVVLLLLLLTPDLRGLRN